MSLRCLEVISRLVQGCFKGKRKADVMLFEGMCKGYVKAML